MDCKTQLFVSALVLALPACTKAEAGPRGLLDGGAPIAASAPYSPCPGAGKPCAIMAIGDSITCGAGGSGGGYHVELFHQAMAHKQAIAFVGNVITQNATTDGVTFPVAHEGHSGFTIDTIGGQSGVLPLVAGAIQSKRPHIVTLMIGTNDVASNLEVASAPARLARLIDTILSSDPKLLLVVAQIVPTADDATNVKVRAFNAAIPGLVASRANAGKHISMVDMYSAISANPKFKTEYLHDWLHPTDAGYVVMGNTLYTAIRPYLR